MRYATRLLSIVLSLSLAVLTGDAVTSGEEPNSEINEAAQARTDLYDRFDPEQVGRKYLSHFAGNAEFSAVSNFRVTPPNRWFKTFRIKGQIPAEELTQLLDSLQYELKGLAEGSSVEVVAIKESVEERPVGLLKALCATYTVKLSSLQGRRFPYRLGQARGDIDVLVFQFVDGEDGDLNWCVLCSVHEPAEPGSDQARILGTWRLIGSIGGEEVPHEALGTEVEFTADFMILKPNNADGPGDWVKLRYELDPAHEPKHINTRHRLSSEENPIIQLGIYSLENGELKFALASAGQPRPKDFQSIPQAFVLERAEEP